MTIRLIRVILTAFIPLIAPLALEAQITDLRSDKPFFQKKTAEFGYWLKQNKLSHLFKVDSVGVMAKKVTLFLKPAHGGQHVCDSMRCAWDKLEKANRQVNGQYFHERLLHKWAFLAEVPEEQAEVIIRCHPVPHFQAKITAKNGKIPVETRIPRSAVQPEVSIPASLQGVNTGDNTAIFYGKKVSIVCNTARNFLINYYKAKGTPVLWKARVDTSYAAYDEFVLEVTHLSYEICPDGYFEYHRIYVRGLQKGDDVELNWEFQGKYGSGIWFPPRKNDYVDMEKDYKNNLEEYQKRLFKQVTNYLRR